MMSEATYCRLCLENKADKKGSHIVPHFLLKRIENIDGKTERDYELGFEIGRMGMSSHFGRAVQPYILEETFGNITDDDIEKNSHPLIVDNYYCSECEKRFSLIESEYSLTMSTVNSETYESGVSSLLGILFWGSIVWRISNHGKNGVKLPIEQEESLRSILNKFLPNNHVNDLQNIDINNENDLSKISYKLIRYIELDKEDPKFLVIIPYYRNLFVLFVDEFILAYALNDNYEEFKNPTELGLEKLFQGIEKNTIFENEKITPFQRDNYLNTQNKLVFIARDQYLDGVSKFCDSVHKEFGGQGDHMPEEIKKEIFSELILSEKELGRRYNQTELIKSVIKVMKKHCH